MPGDRALINTIETRNQRGNAPGSNLDGLAPWNRASELHWRAFWFPGDFVRGGRPPPVCLSQGFIPVQVVPTARWTPQEGSPHGPEASSPLSISWLLCERTPLLLGPQGIGFISISRDSPSEVSVAPSNELSLQTALNTDCLRKTALQN